jgi:hypothetical protein
MALDFVQETDDLKSFAVRFVLSPRQWGTFACSIALGWQRVKFDRLNSENVPNATGIYAFAVEYPDSQLPPHGYVMYIGITKSDGGGNLRKRYRQYLDEKRVLKRAKVHYMLNKWFQHLYFHYAEVTDPQCDIRDLEQRLCDALVPPYNKNDFSAMIRKQVQAFRD